MTAALFGRRWTAPEFVPCVACGENRPYYGPGAPIKKRKRRWWQDADALPDDSCPCCGAC